MRYLYKNEHLLHYYTEKKFYNTFFTKFSTRLNPTDILANTSHVMKFEHGSGNKKTHTCFLTRHLQGDDCLLRSMTILIASTRT